MEILSIEEIQAIKRDLDNFKEHTTDTIKGARTVINGFTSNAVAQSLFKSGGFGESQKKRLEEILEAMEEYEAMLSGSGGLYTITEQYLDSQKKRTETAQ